MKLHRLLINSSFVRDFTIVLSGASIAQIITLACTPILTRQYTTDQFGIFGIFMAIAVILSVCSTARMNMGIMLPKKDSDAINVLTISLVIAVTVSLITFLLIPAKSYISTTLNVPELKYYIFLIPLYILLTGFKDSFEIWSSRNKLFSIISLSLIFGSLLSNSWRVLMGYLDPSASHLIYGAILLLAGSVTILLTKNYTYLAKEIRLYYNYNDLRGLFQKYSHLPKYRAPKDLLSAISQNLPAILLAYFFSPMQVGLYILADRVLRLPSVIVGKSIQKVFYQKATEIFNQGNSLANPIIKTTLGLSTIGLLPFLVLMIFSPQLFSFIFGNEWFRAGEYARWISLWMFMGFINVPSITSIPILGLEKFFLKFELIATTLRVFALIFGGFILNNDLQTVIIFSVLGALLNIFVIYYVIGKAKNYSLTTA